VNIGKKGRKERIIMTILSIIDRRFFAAVITLMCVICSFASPLTVSAAESSALAYNEVYDLNSDGVIDDTDVDLMTAVLLSNMNSGFRVSDVIRASRIAKADSTAKSTPAPNLNEFLVSEMDVCEGNSMIFINLLFSDFHFVVYENDETINFQFLEDNIPYYNIEWTKEENVVCNVDLEPDDCLVSRDIADVSLKVFIDNDHYVLDVVDIPCITHYPVDTFITDDAYTKFLIKSFTNDFDKEIVEDRSFKFSKNGITEYVIDWDAQNVRYNKSISSDDCIVSYEYLGKKYQVFIEDDKFILNVVTA